MGLGLHTHGGNFGIMENKMETTIGVVLGVFWDNSPP